MVRTLHGIAAGAAIVCLALAPQRIDAGDGEAAAVRETLELAPLVEPQAVSDIAPADDDLAGFVWSGDDSLTPPAYSFPVKSSYLTPPSVAAAVVPLPPAAWTGFASLAGLGTIALLRRLRRAR